MACVYALVSAQDMSEIRYVGMSKHDDPTHRLRAHLSNARAKKPVQRPVVQWLQSQLADGHSVHALTLESGLTFDQAYDVEHYVITVLADTCKLLNLTDGGKGALGWVPSEETRRKIGDANRGNSHPHTEEFKQRQRERFLGDGNPSKREEVRKKISASLTGRPGHKHTEETKRQIAETQRGVPKPKLSDEAKRKISEAGRGRKHSEEVKQRISESNKGQKRSEETRRRISEARAGKKLSDAHRQAISDAQRGAPRGGGKPLTDAHKAKLSAASKGKPKSPEHRAKLIAALNRRQRKEL